MIFPFHFSADSLEYSQNFFFFYFSLEPSTASSEFSSSTLPKFYFRFNHFHSLHCSLADCSIFCFFFVAAIARGQISSTKKKFDRNFIRNFPVCHSIAFSTSQKLFDFIFSSPIENSLFSYHLLNCFCFFLFFVVQQKKEKRSKIPDRNSSNPIHFTSRTEIFPSPQNFCLLFLHTQQHSRKSY